MFVDVLVEIGRSLLCFLAGVLIGQSIGHLNMSTFTSREILEKFVSLAITPLIAKINSTHIGNAITGLLLLFIGMAILLLSGFELGANLGTLFVFAGFAVNFVVLALWMDSVKY